MRRLPLRFIPIIVTLLVAHAAWGDEPALKIAFDAPEALDAWQGVGAEAVALDRAPHGLAVRIERAATEEAGSRTIRLPLPLDTFRGTRIRVDATAKADAVVEPPQAWNGVKCMIHTVSPGGPRWSQQNSLFGTWDWRRIGFTTEIPADATEAWLVLGLEQTTGRVWFDDIAIRIVGARRRPPSAKPSEPAFRGHDLPRLRGAMISPRVTAEDLEVLGGDWKANHIRWQLTWGGFPRSPADTVELPEYEKWLEASLAHVDELLPVCRRLGIRVLIDLHTPPGGRNDQNECRMFHEARFQEAFVAIWERMATRYRDNEAVWGYDLVNEPVEGAVGEGLLDWHALALRTAQRVRAIDPRHAIIVEPAPWGGPDALEWFEPLDVPGIVYSVHMYLPHEFTHQGVHDSRVGIAYPGTIGGMTWDKERLRKALQPAIDYQRDYGVHIYIGEFSAIRWAPDASAHRYLRDCIDLFEEYGWDWAYHAFREWDGWSVEHGADRAERAPSAAPTDREKLLRSWYAGNRR